MTTRCNHQGPNGQRCLVEKGHFGFHKSPHMSWPNLADSPERWAGMGWHLLRKGPIPELSLREIEYAVEMYHRSTRSG